MMLLTFVDEGTSWSWPCLGSEWRLVDCWSAKDVDVPGSALSGFPHRDETRQGTRRAEAEEGKLRQG